MNELILLSNSLDIKVKVSSTLNKQSQYAAKNMFDNDLNSCWNSDQGQNQYIIISFNNRIIPKVIKFMFQGGFVGQEGFIEIGDKLDTLDKIDVLDDLQDNNTIQQFDININNKSCQYMKISFPYSTDFYGRITIYSLEVFGYR